MNELPLHSHENDPEFLIELSMSNLKNNVKRSFGPEREQRSNRIQVTNYQLIPSLPEKTLLVKANIRGIDSNYQTQIRFTNVKFSDTLQPLFTLIRAVDGSDYYVRQFTSAQTQAKVKCNCLDFYYRFSVWNHQKSALEGDPPKPYVRRTDYMPPVNPDKTPGMCKHVIKLLQFLKTENLVR